MPPYTMEGARQLCQCYSQDFLKFRISHAQHEYDSNIHRDEDGDSVEGICMLLKVVKQVHPEESAK